MANSAGSRKNQNKKGTHQATGSVSGDAFTDDNEASQFIFKFTSALEDTECQNRLLAIIRDALQPTQDLVTTLSAKITRYETKLAEKDAEIACLRSEVRELRLANDALDQYGRRATLRIAGIEEDRWGEDTTPAVVELANDVLGLNPPLEMKDIDVSHRLPLGQDADPTEARPVIVRFMTRTDRTRFISKRGVLKGYHEAEEGRPRYYISEDLTAHRAKLFTTTRNLQKAGKIGQCWTYNGNIKIKTLEGVVKPVSDMADLSALLPGIEVSNYLPQRRRQRPDHHQAP